VTPEPPSLAGYPATAGDEVVDSSGRLRHVARPLVGVLERSDLPELAGAAASAFRAFGGEVVVRRDGRPTVQVMPLDPVPRLIERREWDALSAGVVQRHCALNAFLRDVYRAGGRRRSDPDRAPEIVRAGVLPEWTVVGSPVHDPAAVGMAWSGQQRIALLGCDVVRTVDGRWLARADDARLAAGLGTALAVRRAMVAAGHPLGPPTGAADPGDCLPFLRAALDAAAPPECARPPVVAVLGSRDVHAPAAEDVVLGAALGIALVSAADLWPRSDGGIAIARDGRRVPVDVLYLRLEAAELTAHRTPTGQLVGALLADAVRAGQVGLVNAPGNALADDPSSFAGVPAMIRFYLGEDPILEQLPTWVLADADQWATVRERLHELVVVPLAAYGGGPVVVGPECSAAELAELQAEVAAAPHRFIARECPPPSTVPTLVEGRLVPCPVDLRVFSAATGAGEVRALDAPLTRVTAAQGRSTGQLGTGATAKDTWLLHS
jgi:uncharacterized circularly permuted ATP-grasp superfamily protein